MTTDSPILYVVALQPREGYEDEFNEWYDTLHVPELLRCPGFRSAKRYRIVENVKDAPQYLALYELDSLDAFHAPEYLALRARTPEDLDPLARSAAQHRTQIINGRYELILERTEDEV